MKYFKFFSIILLVVSCTSKPSEKKAVHSQFSSELKELKDYFQIPGLAVAVIEGDRVIYEDYKGLADVKNEIPVDANHLFPIASLTKIFTGVTLMKLVEDEKLRLDEPLKKYLPQAKTLSDSIQIKHVLSHTSQGAIGEKFYYSSRFSALTRVIEEVSGVTFKEYLEKEIFIPLKLQNTHLLKDSIQVQEKQLRIAKPYVLDDGIKEGFIDFGFSASAGIVSNLEDLKTFNDALDSNSLISKESKQKMFTSFKEELPYGYGIFNQQVNGVEVVWGYGQYDCYSSLFLKVPKKNLTLLLLANNNLMSDPARLIYGDVSSSLFALSFLKNYVFDFTEMKLLESGKPSMENATEFYRTKLLAQALSESFLSRFDSKRIEKSTELLEAVFETYPNYQEYGNINLLHTLTFLKDVHFYRELGEFNKFDLLVEELGVKIQQKDFENPYVNIYLGTYFYRKGEGDKAKIYFENIVKAQNFSRNWYTQEAENALKSLSE